MKSKLVASLVLAAGLNLMPAMASAQNLTCAVKYKGVTTPMFYFGPNQSHHSDKTVDPLTVMIQEKSDRNKVEITIMEATEDSVWENLTATLEKSTLTAEEQRQVRQLGRTRVTHAFLGLYNGILHFEHKLGPDANLFEISCAPKN